MRLGTGFPEGPCRRGDILGLDTVYEKLVTVFERTSEGRYKPDAYLNDLVTGGDTGKETGQGFFAYEE